MNIFEENKFPKRTNEQNLEQWIKANKNEIFALKKQSQLPWAKISKELTEFMDSPEYIRPSVLTEKLVFEFFTTSRKFDKKIKI